MPLATEVQAERKIIVEEGESLALEKDHAIRANAMLPACFAIRVLRHMQRIIQHDVSRRDQHGNEIIRRRRGNLSNLSIAARLLRDGSHLIPYNPQNFYGCRIEGYEGNNIFDHLTYLSRSNLMQYTTPLASPEYVITDEEAISVLNEFCQKFSDIITNELAIYEMFLAVSPVLIPPPAISAVLLAVRTQYQDSRKINHLYVLTAYQKEVRSLNNAIAAINQALALLILPTSHQAASKRVFLRCLIIIGEACTQQNLCPPSRALCALFSEDFKLFLSIRNKLAHNEWDIHTSNIDNYIQANDFINFRAGLIFLREQFNLIVVNLEQHYQQHRLYEHYNSASVPHHAATFQKFDQVRIFLAAQTQTGKLYTQHKVRFPDKFSSVAMAQRAQNEIQEIQQLLAEAPGVATLDDPHEEDMHLLSGQYAKDFLQRMKATGLANSIVLNAINTIETNPAGVSIEVSVGIFAEYFNPQSQPDGQPIQNRPNFFVINFVALAEQVKRYARYLELTHYIAGPSCRAVIEYHLGRLVKFLGEMIKQHNFGEGMIAQLHKEVIVLRNIIEHNDYEIESITGRSMASYICHYLAHVIQVVPGILAQLIPNLAVIAVPVV